MDRHPAQEKRPPVWQTVAELPVEVFEIWQKPVEAISPFAVLATINADGAPWAAPFGSLRAVTPRLLRLCMWRGHDTYANLCRDGRVMVALVCQDVAVSVRGQARVVKEWMDHDETLAALEIDVEEVKNDMAYRTVVESGIQISTE